MTVNHCFVVGSGLCGSRAFVRTIGHHPEIWHFPWEFLLLSGRPGPGKPGLVNCLHAQAHDQSDFWAQLPYLFHRHLYDANSFSGFHRVISDVTFYNWASEFWQQLMATAPASVERETVIAQAYRSLVQTLVDANNLPGFQKQVPARYVIDRSPANILCLDFICRADRGARIFHIVRNGMEVANSCLRRGWYPSFEDALVNWRDLVIMGLNFADHPAVLTLAFDLINQDKRHSFTRALEHLRLAPIDFDKMVKLWEPREQQAFTPTDEQKSLYAAYANPVLALTKDAAIHAEITRYL